MNHIHQHPTIREWLTPRGKDKQETELAKAIDTEAGRLESFRAKQGDADAALREIDAALLMADADVWSDLIARRVTVEAERHVLPMLAVEAGRRVNQATAEWAGYVDGIAREDRAEINQASTDLEVEAAALKMKIERNPNMPMIARMSDVEAIAAQRRYADLCEELAPFRQRLQATNTILRIVADTVSSLRVMPSAA